MYRLYALLHGSVLSVCYRASRVCSTWRDAARDPSLWRNLDLSYGNIKHCQKALTKLYEQDKLGKLTNINLSGRSDVSTQTITVSSA